MIARLFLIAALCVLCEASIFQQVAEAYIRNLYEMNRPPRQARPAAEMITQRDKLAHSLKAAWKELKSAKKGVPEIKPYNELRHLFAMEDVALNNYMAPGFTDKELQVWRFADCPSKTQQPALKMRAKTTGDGQRTYEIKYLEYQSRMKYCGKSKECRRAAKTCYTSTTKDFCLSAGVLWKSRCEKKVNAGIPQMYDDSTYSILANHALGLPKRNRQTRELMRFAEARKAVVKLLRKIATLFDDMQFAGVAWDVEMKRADLFAEKLEKAQRECVCKGFDVFRSTLHNNQLITDPVIVLNGGYTAEAADAASWGISHARHAAMKYIMDKYRKYAAPVCLEAPELIRGLVLSHAPGPAFTDPTSWFQKW